MKICYKCKIEKEYSCFYKVHNTNYHDSLCKDCRKAHVINWRKCNPDKVKRQIYDYSVKNKDEIKASKKRYYSLNKGKLNLKKSKYYELNRESILVKAKIYAKLPNSRLRINTYRKNKYKNDIKYRLECNLRSRIRIAIKYNFKSEKTMSLIGCSTDFLKRHLESRWTTNMSWDNHGFGIDKWHIDHIKPCCQFDLSKQEEQKKCFHYSNLQPLWQKDNLAKKKKLQL